MRNSGRKPRGGFRAVNERIDTTNAEVRALSDRIDTTNAEVRTLSDRIDTTNAEVRALSDRIDTTNAEVRALSDRLSENTRVTRRLEGHVGRLIGRTYEDRCRNEIAAILDGWLKCAVIADRDMVQQSLLQARTGGLISREDYLDGLRPDIIAREMDDTEQTGRLAVVEASITFNRNDLEHARPPGRNHCKGHRQQRFRFRRNAQPLAG